MARPEKIRTGSQKIRTGSGTVLGVLETRPRGLSTGRLVRTPRPANSDRSIDSEVELAPMEKYLPSDPMEAAVVAHLRRQGYAVLGDLGRGGMGVVYKAIQQRLNRLVAVKVRSFGPADGPHRERFRAEAEAMARLHHPNIIQVYDFSGAAVPYIVMEFVHGPSLRQFIDGFARSNTPRRPIPIRWAVSLLRIAAVAVQYAHERGVVHRDFKPENILLEARSERGPWVPKLCDFG